MATHHVIFGDAELMISLTGEGAAVEGKPVDAAISPLGNGVYSILLGGESFRVVLSGGGPETTVQCAGATGNVKVESARSRLLKQFAGVTGEAHREMVVRAPMPALVVRIEVEVGQQVEKGEGLVVLEAMKMENELNAPHAGIVKEILTEKGKSVEKGALLVKLE